MAKRMNKQEMEQYLKSNSIMVKRVNAFVVLWQLIFMCIMLVGILGLIVALKYLWIALVV